MSVYQGTNLIAGGRQCMPLLSFMWADHQLNDISWLRADTFSWQSGTVYTAVYQHLVDDYNNAKYKSIVFSAHGDTFECFRTPSLDTTHSGADYYAWVNSIYGTLYTTSNQPEIGDTIYDDTFAVMSPTVGVIHENNQTETISGTTITYYTAPDGHKIVLENQESNVAAIYAATGVAWYYILDTANQRFKLPRTRFGFTGLRDTVGRYVQEGLPNINGGSSGWVLTNTNGAVGALSGNNFTKTLNGYVTNPNWNISSNGGEWYRDINFDASLSNSIYGRSDTVQPKATQMYLYFYVGQFTQTALENTAGLNAELFNGKADLNLANVLANIDFVVERQEPTAVNRYTWYRKYRSGWVEQGGRFSFVFSGSRDSVNQRTLPITMANNVYNIAISGASLVLGVGYFCVGISGQATTYFSLYGRAEGNISGTSELIEWRVAGMAAN